jgi:hypothetical protein
MLAKWTQIIASAVLTLLAAAVLLRDWRYHDKTTKKHGIFTVSLLVLLVVTALALAWAMWATFPEPPSKPAFSFFLNGHRMETGVVLPVTITNRARSLVIAVQNHGTAPAERLTVHAVAAKGTIEPLEGWTQQPSGFESSQRDLVERSGLVHYQIEATGIIEPTCYFVCPAFSIRDPVGLPCTLSFAVVAASKPAARDAVGLTLSISDSSSAATNRDSSGPTSQMQRTRR